MPLQPKPAIDRPTQEFESWVGVSLLKDEGSKFSSLYFAAQSPFRQFDRLERAAGFVERFLILGGWLAVGHDACSDLNRGLAPLDDDSAQRYAGVHVTAVVDVADRPGVGPATVRLEFVDD